MGLPARRNPFRSERLHELKFRFIDDSLEQAMSRLEQSGFRGAVVGPQGSGKTTFLLELGQYLDSLGHCSKYFCVGQNGQLDAIQWSELAQCKSGMSLLVDGTELLGPLRWLQFIRMTRSARAVIVTRHTPRRLPTILRTQTTVELVEQLIAELLNDSAEPPSHSEIGELFQRYGGDARQILRALYDRYSA